MSGICRWFSHPQRWMVGYSRINGQLVNIDELAKANAARVEKIENIRRSQISCTAEIDRETGEIDVSSLKVWMDTDTHGRWAMNQTTEFVKNILVQHYGAFIPWYKR